MDINAFPFKVDDRTHTFLSAFVTASRQSQCRIQSLINGTCSILFDKNKDGGLDGNIAFTHEAIKIQYTVKSIASKDPEVASWLNKYHSTLQKQKKDTLTPIVNRCFVEVHAFYDGRLEYYLTYMVAHSDESISQDTAQGTLYNRSGLNIGRQEPSQPSPEQRPEGQSPGHW